jgi:hypothetical protein
MGFAARPFSSRAALWLSRGSSAIADLTPRRAKARQLRRLQLAGNSAERGAKVSADQGERRNRCDRDQRGNQRVLDRRDARLIVDEL